MSFSFCKRKGAILCLFSLYGLRACLLYLQLVPDLFHLTFILPQFHSFPHHFLLSGSSFGNLVAASAPSLNERRKEEVGEEDEENGESGEKTYEHIYEASDLKRANLIPLS